jgi:Pyruvate/2-oxoacid:ferredoxin oxidoreductase delta subunit
LESFTDIENKVGMKDNGLKELGELVNAPEFIRMWLDRFYEPVEISVIREIEEHLTDMETLKKTMGFSQDTLERFFKRGVLSENKEGNLIPADFHVRYDIWALFEGFKDIPEDIRNRLNRWELDDYIKTQEKNVERIRKTGEPDPSTLTPRYLLLDEAFEVLDQVERIYLWPCNCRSMIQACNKPVYTCLRFHNNKGQGFEISREKAKEIVLRSNKKGLMQSGELGRDADGKRLGGICNCCAECCFPHLLAREMKAEKIWPFSRYVARWLEKECSFCGLCAKRCPFQAFTYEKEKKNKEDRLNFCKELCRGCGLCSVTCPEKAIEMKKIEEV